MSSHPERPLHVGIGIIRRGRLFLVRQRPVGTVYAGYWEFPGGKCEPGETPAQATQRECLEEVGIPITVDGLRQERTHRYPHGWVHLTFYDCHTTDPNAEPQEGTHFVWVDGQSLATLRFPEANDDIVAALSRETQNSQSE